MNQRLSLPVIMLNESMEQGLRFPIQSLIDFQLAKKFPFTEPKGLQQPATCPYPEPDKSNLNPSRTFVSWR